MKNLRMMRPVAFVTRPAITVGTAPASSTPAKQSLGPKRSQSGPMIRRTTRLYLVMMFQLIIHKYQAAGRREAYVAVRPAMLEFAMSS